jgi:hypothetical protein
MVVIPNLKKNAFCFRRRKFKRKYASKIDNHIIYLGRLGTCIHIDEYVY